jgi:adenosylhomocysteine nucleosidase
MKTNQIFRYSLLALLILYLAWQSLSESNRWKTDYIVVGAFPDETAALLSRLEDRKSGRIREMTFTKGRLADRRIVLANVGVGKVNAAMTTTLLLEHFKPKGLIFSGVAGALNPDLAPGDLVLASATAQHDLGDVYADSIANFGVRNPVTGERNPVFFPADPALLAAAQQAAQNVRLDPIPTGAGSRNPVILTGVIVTGDGFIMSSAKKAELRRRLQADAVDMESAAVAQICRQFGVPCLIIRALSDYADENAQTDFERFYAAAAGNAAQIVAETLRRLR